MERGSPQRRLVIFYVKHIYGIISALSLSKVHRDRTNSVVRACKRSLINRTKICDGELIPDLERVLGLAVKDLEVFYSVSKGMDEKSRSIYGRLKISNIKSELDEILFLYEEQIPVPCGNINFFPSWKGRVIRSAQAFRG